MSMISYVGCLEESLSMIRCRMEEMVVLEEEDVEEEKKSRRRRSVME